MSYPYLEAFFSYFREGKQEGPRLSDKVRASIDKTRHSMAADGVTFEFVPIAVTESVKPGEMVTKYVYQGTYYYGFLKNGVFHEVPGDLSTAAEKKPLTGSVTITVDQAINTITSVEESFAGNTFGEQPKKTLWQKVTSVLALLAALLFIFGNLLNLNSLLPEAKPKPISSEKINALTLTECFGPADWEGDEQFVSVIKSSVSRGHPTWQVLDIGSVCSLSDQTRLVTFSYSENGQNRQAVRWLDVYDGRAAEAKNFSCSTGRYTVASVITTLDSGTLKLVCDKLYFDLNMHDFSVSLPSGR